MTDRECHMVLIEFGRAGYIGEPIPDEKRPTSTSSIGQEAMLNTNTSVLADGISEIYEQAQESTG